MERTSHVPEIVARSDLDAIVADVVDSHLTAVWRTSLIRIRRRHQWRSFFDSNLRLVVILDHSKGEENEFDDIRSTEDMASVGNASDCVSTFQLATTVIAWRCRR